MICLSSSQRCALSMFYDCEEDAKRCQRECNKKQGIRTLSCHEQEWTLNSYIQLKFILFVHVATRTPLTCLLLAVSTRWTFFKQYVILYILPYIQLQGTRNTLNAVELPPFTLAHALLPLHGRLAQSPRLLVKNGQSSSVFPFSLRSFSLIISMFQKAYRSEYRLRSSSFDKIFVCTGACISIWGRSQWTPWQNKRHGVLWWLGSGRGALCCDSIRCVLPLLQTPSEPPLKHMLQTTKCSWFGIYTQQAILNPRRRLQLCPSRLRLPQGLNQLPMSYLFAIH